VAVPVLLAVSAALVGLRAFPWLLRPVTRIAGRLRGAALFLGLARTARTRIVLLAPVVVVVGVTTATFSAALAGGLSDARDRAADRDVPADVLVTSLGGLRPGTVAKIRTAPGVRAAAAFALVLRQGLRADDSGMSSTLTADVVVAEDTALARVRALSGHGDPLPDLSADRGAVGALVSPDLARQLPGHGRATVGDRTISFRIAGTITAFPTASPDAGNLILLPAAALGAGGTLDGTGIAPTSIALAGSQADLRDLGRPAPAIETWTGHRAALDTYGGRPTLTFALDCGMAAGLLAALLALVLLVLSGAEDRARLFARLRPLGFPAGRWWVVPGCELGLPVLVTVAAGAVAGLLVPYVLGPAFGLAGITGGVPVTVRVSGGLAALLGGFGALAVLTVVLAGARARSRTSIEAEAS
jgi:putative ABC transport system permease protein